MLNVSFKNIPSAYREYFEKAGFKMQKGGLLKKSKETQPEEVYKAEEHLNKLVDLLEPSEEVELSLHIEDDDDEQSYSLDNIHVTSKTQGLEDLADQVAVENGNDDASMKLVWLLHDQLGGKEEDEEADENEQEYEKNQEDSSSDEEKQEADDMAISSPVMDDSMSDNMRKILGLDNGGEAAKNSPAFSPAMQAATAGQEINPGYPSQPAAPSVMTLGEYADSSLLDKAVAAYTGESLNVNQQAKALGLVDEPKDKYDRELNATIISEMAKHGLDRARGDFLATLGTMKNSALEDLTKHYKQVNAQTVAEAAQTDAESDLDAFKEEIQDDNRKFKNDLQTKQQNKKEELRKAREDLIEKYRQDLEAKDKLLMDDFVRQCEQEIESHKRENEDRLAQKTSEKMLERQNQIVDQRNQDLEEYRQNALLGLAGQTKTTFEKSNEKLSAGLKAISPTIKETVKKIDAEREAAKKEEEAAQARKKALELRERQLAIDEFTAKEEQRVHDAELSLKRQELEYHNQLLTRSFERPFDAFTAPSQKANPYGRHADTTASVHQTDAASSASRQADAYAGASQATDAYMNVSQRRERKEQKGSEEQEDDSAGDVPTEEKAVRKNEPEKSKPESLKADDLTEKDKRHIKAACFLAVFVALGSSIGGAIWSVYSKDEMTMPMTSMSSGQKTEDDKASAMSAVAKSASSKAASSKQKEEVAKLEASQARLMKKYQKMVENKKAAYGYAGYMKAKTKADKMEQLDAMLGQEDVKSLRKINKTKASKTSRLYQALADGSESQARVLWMSMSKEQQAGLSKLARNSVALSFYAVSDWQHGWQAKEGV